MPLSSADPPPAGSGLPDHLRRLLKRVSRSFYLSVRILPGPVRAQIAVAYLLARAADTIADTTLLPEDVRLQSLAELRQTVRGDRPARQTLLPRLTQAARGNPGDGEAALLLALDECLDCFFALSPDDQKFVEHVLDQLILGMERDLTRFPSPQSGRAVAPGEVVALQNRGDLDEYTYYAAGCVGEFWTELMAAHLPTMAQHKQPELVVRGVALGKALQMVNVIRDVESDLHNGRCYWPADILAEQGLDAQKLAALFSQVPSQVAAADRAAVKAATTTLINIADELVAIARPYVEAIPQSEMRLRLACLWPLLLAEETLQLLRAHETPLGRRIKVPRKRVYELVLRSSASAAAALLRASFAA